MSDQPIAPAKPELTIATAPLEDEPTLKKLRVELPASPLSASLGSNVTPQSPSSGVFVKVKTISRPNSQATIPSPSARSPQTPQSATSSASIATATTPLTSSSVPLHSSDLVERWAAALTRSMMKHWPKDEEAQVLTMMRRVAARVPGAAGVAAGQVRALLTAFQDPKNEKLRGDVMGEMIEIERLVRMNEMELTNPEQQAKCEREFIERNKSKDWTELKKSMSAGSSDMFKCPRCEQRNTMWEQRQTRSADEPMTIIITCNNCGFYWRKRG